MELLSREAMLSLNGLQEIRLTCADMCNPKAAKVMFSRFLVQMCAFQDVFRELVNSEKYTFSVCARLRLFALVCGYLRSLLRVDFPSQNPLEAASDTQVVKNVEMSSSFIMFHSEHVRGRVHPLDIETGSTLQRQKF